MKYINQATQHTVKYKLRYNILGNINHATKHNGEHKHGTQHTGEHKNSKEHTGEQNMHHNILENIKHATQHSGEHNTCNRTYLRPYTCNKSIAVH